MVAKKATTPAATYKRTLAAKPPPPAKPDPNTFEMGASDGATADSTQSQMLAVLATKTSLAALAMKGYVNSEDLMVKDLVTELKKSGDEVVAGNLGGIERMLVRQAITLDAIFNQMAIKSSKQEYLKQMETFMRLAMKAQAQARATAEALALLKNPQPYIRQANIANGPQQVNNGVSHAQEIKPVQNELLEDASHGSTELDTRATATPARGHTTVETMATIHRAAKRQG